MVNGITVVHQLYHAVDQPARQRTADAAIGKLHDPAVLLCDQRLVDIQRAKIIDQHRKAYTVRGGQDAVQQGGFAAAEKPADDGEVDRRLGHPERAAA